MPKKEKLIKVERYAENSDTPIVAEFTVTEWALLNAFFDENMNQTRAYLKIFPDTKYDSAKVEASKFFTKPNIRAEIIYRMTQDAPSKSEVIKRMGDISRASYKPFIKISEDGFAYFDFSDPEAQENLHLIKKMKTKRERRIVGDDEDAETWETESVELELHDSTAALRDLGKFHKLLTDKVENSGYVINFDWNDLSAEQIARLRSGEDPEVIEKEIEENKKKK